MDFSVILESRVVESKAKGVLHPTALQLYANLLLVRIYDHIQDGTSESSETLDDH